MCGKRQQWKVLCVERGNSGKKQAAVARKKANMELRQQAVMLVAAIEEAEDVVAKNEGWHSLVRRRSNLEAAWASYEKAFYPHIRVADEEACAAASKSRCILRDSSDEALDLLETLIEAKAEEEASDVEVEDEICAAKAEAVVERHVKDLVYELCAKDELESGSMAKVEVKEAANKVEVEICANEEVLLRSGQLDPGEEVRQINTKDKLEQEFGAKEWVAAKEALDAGEAGKGEVMQSGGLDPGEGAGIVEVEKLSVSKVKEVKWPNVEVKWLNVEVKLLGFLGYEFVLQVPEARMLRFVNWVSHSLAMNSDFG